MPTIKMRLLHAFMFIGTMAAMFRLMDYFFGGEPTFSRLAWRPVLAISIAVMLDQQRMREARKAASA